MESLPIKFRCAQQGMQTLINNYSAWHRQKKIYNPDLGPPVLKFSPDGYQIFDRHQVDKINDCNDDIILIDNIGEGANSLPWIERYKKGPKYVIFTNGTWIDDKMPVANDFVLITYYLFLYDYATMYFTSTRPMSISGKRRYLFEETKPYSFISLVGTPRDDRKLLADKILQNITHDDFVLKLGGRNLKQSPPKEYDSINLLADPVDFYLNPVMDNGGYRWTSISHSIPIELYNQAHFFLIVETEISDVSGKETFHLTEKTMKCLLTGMPFVMMSTYKFLHNLHKLGFMTYESLWDESYDLESKFENRSEKIINLCNELYKFDWDSNREKLKSISLHNLEVCANVGEKMDDFFTDLIDVIESIDR